MATEEDCPPGAQLMESMRAVGYSLQTALADIVDNSVSAEATLIEIYYSATEHDPYVAILDNGLGMAPGEARRAMQLAGNGVVTVRSKNDLGRFGLGLKTASLSQCRRLTVVTKQANVVTGLVWDLDHLAKTNSWSLLTLSESEIQQLAHVDEILDLPSGTLVIWSNLDRFSAQTREIVGELDAQMVDSKNHLSLIFHQFLNGDNPHPKVDIFINGNQLQGLDPFLSKSPRTLPSRGSEVIRVSEVDIHVQSFTLPFINKMTSSERALALAPGSLRDSQGFYIYRAGRLVIWGTWFRLMPKNDTGKLARVKVDIPNALDHLWSLDIKKSSAVPPIEVRERLRHLAGKMLEPSQAIHNYRGRKAKSEDVLVRPWELLEDRETFRYEINRNHPIFSKLIEEASPETLRSLNEALGILERTFPVQDLFNRMSNDLVPQTQPDQVEFLKSVLLDIWKTVREKEHVTGFVDRMIHFEPWDVFATERESLESWLLENEGAANV
jgi:hypothetical protein